MPDWDIFRVNDKGHLVTVGDAAVPSTGTDQEQGEAALVAFDAESPLPEGRYVAIRGKRVNVRIRQTRGTIIEADNGAS